VKDWVQFLRNDWAVAVVHDRFAQLTSDMRAELMQFPDVSRLVREVHQQATEGHIDGVISKLREESVGIAGSSLPASARAAVEARVTSFLAANRPLLPMFFLPGHVALPTVDGSPAESHLRGQ
jgi:hypothetical protein